MMNEILKHTRIIYLWLPRISRIDANFNFKKKLVSIRAICGKILPTEAFFDFNFKIAKSNIRVRKCCVFRQIVNIRHLNLRIRCLQTRTGTQLIIQKTKNCFCYSTRRRRFAVDFTFSNNLWSSMKLSPHTFQWNFLVFV